MKGVDGLREGTESLESLLVSIAAPRLEMLGYAVPSPLPEPELRLSRLLDASYGDAAHSRYNALLRRLVSFQRAASCAR